MNTIHNNSLLARIEGTTITLEPGDSTIELQQPVYVTWPIMMDVVDGCYTWSGEEWKKE